MRWIAALLGVVAVCAVLWLAGEQHRENCIRDGRVACSVLPWEDGRPAPKARDDTPYEAEGA